MARTERMTEAIHGKLDLDDMQRKYASGWRLVGFEWEREVSEDEPHAGSLQPETRAEAPRPLHEVPFGFRVAADCAHLEEDPEEMRALNTMMELIVQDISLQRIADELNRSGSRRRDGKPWTTVAIFNIFPRLIEMTPRIFGQNEWQQRRRAVSRVMWNS